MGMIAPAGPLRQPTADRRLDRIYALPNELVSLDDWRRARHHDLAGMDELALELEERRVMNRLAAENRAPDRRDPWLVARLSAVRAEQRAARTGRR